MKVMLFLAVLCGTCFGQHEPPQAAREEVNLGVKAYKAADYDQAIEHFQRAVLIDGDFCTARLYLATAYAQQYIPGVDNKDNTALANKAIEQYQQVLRLQPDSVNSLRGIAFLRMQMKQFAEAIAAYRDALKVSPNDAELYYSIAVIDWSQAYKNTMDQKALLKLGSDDRLFMDGSCPQMRARNLPLVEDGLDMMGQAMKLRKDYDDAMAYVNLLYRQRAEIECGDPAASKADEKKADDWSDLAMQARKRKVEAIRNCASGIVIEGRCKE